MRQGNEVAKCPFMSGEYPEGPDLTKEGLREFERSMPQALESYRRQYGQVFTVRADGNAPQVHVGDSKLIEQIFLDGGSGLESAGSRPFRDLVGEESLVCLNGDNHRWVRKMLGPPLQGKRLRAYAIPITEITKGTLKKGLESGYSTATILGQISLRILARVVFGNSSTTVFHKAYRTFAEILKFVEERERASYCGSLSKDLLDAFGSLQRLIAAEMSARVSSIKSSSEIDGVLDHALHVARERGIELQASALSKQVVTLLIAGPRASAAATGAALQLLNESPESKEKLLKELEPHALLADPAGLASLPYLNAVCRETLRLRVVVINGIPRRCTSEPKPATNRPRGIVEFVPNIFLTHRQSNLYVEPDRFRPERFMEREYAASEFMPFGVGARRCLGAQLAEYQMRISLSVILLTITSRDQLVRPSPATG